MIESVKKAFVLSRQALKLFYVIAAMNVVANAINLLVAPASMDAEITTARSFLVLGFAMVFSLAAVFITAGSLAYIKELIKTGASNIASFVDNAKKYFLRLLGVVVILMSAFTILGVLVFVILGVLPAALKLLAAIIIIPAFLVLIILFLMCPYALISEELGVVGAIKKGILVGKKNFLKILGLVGIMFGVTIVIMITASIASGILTFILRPIATFATAAIMGIANAALAVLVNIAYMDFYLKNASAEGA